MLVILFVLPLFGENLFNEGKSRILYDRTMIKLGNIFARPIRFIAEWFAPTLAFGGGCDL